MSHDPVDEHLRRRLGELAGPSASNAPEVLADLGPTMRRARRRRQAGRAAGGALVVGLAALGLWNLVDGVGSDQPDVVATVPPPSVTTVGPEVTTSVAPPTTRPPTTTRPTTTAPATSAPAPSGPASSAPPPSAAPPPTPAPTAAPTSAPAPTATPAPPTMAEASQATPGGTVVVRYSPDRGAVVDVVATPTPGFVAEIDQRGPIEVKVEFSGGDTEYEVEGRMVGSTFVFDPPDDD